MVPKYWQNINKVSLLKQSQRHSNTWTSNIKVDRLATSRKFRKSIVPHFRLDVYDACAKPVMTIHQHYCSPQQSMLILIYRNMIFAITDEIFQSHSIIQKSSLGGHKFARLYGNNNFWQQEGESIFFHCIHLEVNAVSESFHSK